jgi:sialate O-acetylesterase
VPGELIGVRIDGDLAPFRIIQQDEAGTDTLRVHGRWGSPEKSGTIQLRIVRETDSMVVVPWQSAGRQDAETWQHVLGDVPAGGLYRLESRLFVDPAAPEWGFHGDVVHHIGVGDLWIIGGQSNAAGYGRGPVPDPPELGIHLLGNDETWDIAAHPLNDTTGSTHPNLETANPAHSPYLRFARELRAALGYPIGLVQTALGGSPLSAWNPEENPDAPLYQNLIHSVNLAGGRVRGIVWYQGESDCSPALAATYERRFAEFIQRLRHDLDMPHLPVIIAQLNRYTAAMSVEDHRGWSLLREAQRQAVKLGHVTVVPTLDLALSDAIHTSADGNLILGSRKARAALALVYGRRVLSRAPAPTGAVLAKVRAAD